MYVVLPPHGSDPAVGQVIYGFTKLGKATMEDSPVFCYLIPFSRVLLLLTSGGDPGIISRNAHPPEPEGFNGNVDVGAVQTPQLRLPRIK
ncbi:hypothetical protein ES288_D07G282200v1 [Gossypium darwinii]|uniref:Uncharacterized protein n=1 Tax=Gossypium darwinii TaxID=34276 RepID=A0A5D2C0G8_GOSDA|nr:hypothetical protein ES288_D07G282200v1 [Gossypium darwinii]